MHHAFCSARRSVVDRPNMLVATQLVRARRRFGIRSPSRHDQLSSCWRPFRRRTPVRPDPRISPAAQLPLVFPVPARTFTGRRRCRPGALTPGRADAYSPYIKRRGNEPSIWIHTSIPGDPARAITAIMTLCPPWSAGKEAHCSRSKPGWLCCLTKYVLLQYSTFLTLLQGLNQPNMALYCTNLRTTDTLH